MIAAADITSQVSVCMEAGSVTLSLLNIWSPPSSDRLQTGPGASLCHDILELADNLLNQVDVPLEDSLQQILVRFGW